MWPPRPPTGVDAEMVSTQGPLVGRGVEFDEHIKISSQHTESSSSSNQGFFIQDFTDSTLSISFLLGINKILWHTGRNEIESNSLFAQMSRE